MYSVSVASDGKDVSTEVREVFPRELRAVSSDGEWLIDARPLVDFFFSEAR